MYAHRRLVKSENKKFLFVAVKLLILFTGTGGREERGATNDTVHLYKKGCGMLCSECIIVVSIGQRVYIYIIKAGYT